MGSQLSTRHTFLGKHIKSERIDSSLVDNDEALPLRAHLWSSVRGLGKKSYTQKAKISVRVA